MTTLLLKSQICTFFTYLSLNCGSVVNEQLLFFTFYMKNNIIFILEMLFVISCSRDGLFLPYFVPLIRKLCGRVPLYSACLGAFRSNHARFSPRDLSTAGCAYTKMRAIVFFLLCAIHSGSADSGLHL